MGSLLLGSTIFAQGIDRYQWKQRLLLLFTPDMTHSEFERQLYWLGDYSEEMADRQLLVLRITPEETYQADGTLFNQARTEWFYHYYDADPRNFTAILVGLDGQEKYRSIGLAITPQELFTLIDQMPMRQTQIRRRRGGGG